MSVLGCSINGCRPNRCPYIIASYYKSESCIDFNWRNKSHSWDSICLKSPALDARDSGLYDRETNLGNFIKFQLNILHRFPVTTYLLRPQL